MGSTHFVDVACPWGFGRGQYIGLRDFCHILTLFPDSKWKLGQHWVLSCNFRWANVGCAMQNHPHFAHPKKCWPNMLYKRWTNMLYKRWPNMLYKRLPNMFYKRWPNMLGKRWLSVNKWKLSTMFFFNFHFLNG